MVQILVNSVELHLCTLPNALNNFIIGEKQLQYNLDHNLISTYLSRITNKTLAQIPKKVPLLRKKKY